MIIGNNFVDDHGRSVLHHAAFYGDQEMVKLLLYHFKMKRIDVNARDNDGRTPLHMAARSGNLKVTKKVLYK